MKSVRFVFTAPAFVPQDAVREKLRKERREFYIPGVGEASVFGTEYEIRLRNRLMQKAVAKRCGQWIKKGNVKFMSVAEYGQIPDMFIVETTAGNVVYVPFNGFTADTLGYERGQYFSVISTRMSLRERKLQPEIGMCASADECENKCTVFDGVQKNPVVLNVAIAKADHVADKCMIFELWRKLFAVRQLLDHAQQFGFVEAAFQQLLEVFAKPRRFDDAVFHENKNSSSFSGSEQDGALGSLANRRASSKAASVSSRGESFFLTPSLKGISPVARHFFRKQVTAVVMFMPISSKNSSASALRSLSTRMERVAVMSFLHICHTTSRIVSRRAGHVNAAA